MNKKSIIIIILCVLAVGLGWYFLYDKILKEDNKSIKINNDLDYVYDADYSYDNKYKEFDRPFVGEENGKRTITYYGIDVEYNMGMQYLSDLKVPYINIDSEDAKRVNNKMKELYLDYAKDFDRCAEESLDKTNPSCSQILTYRTYLYDDILSVVVINSIQATSNWVLNYSVFNFDLNTGKFIKYDDVLSKLGYDYDSTTSELKVLLKDKMDSLYSKYVDLKTACNNNSNCYDIAYRLLENDIKYNSIMYFVTSDGKLNVLVNPICDSMENGTVSFYLVTVEK